MKKWILMLILVMVFTMFIFSFVKAQLTGAFCFVRFFWFLVTDQAFSRVN